MPTRRRLLVAAALAPALVTPFGATRQVMAQEATPTVPQGAITPETDIVYGEVDGEQLLLDVYRA